LAKLPPFDKAPHELRFGIVRSDGSYKPVAQMLADFAARGHVVTSPPPPIAREGEHYAGLPQSIEREYREYCERHG